MKTLYLFNRDLRVQDNKALELASIDKYLVCAVALKNTDKWGEAKKQFYFECLNDLSINLDKHGKKLYVVEKSEDLLEFDKVILTKNYNSKEIPFLDDFKNEIVEVEQSTLFSLSELPFDVQNLKKTFTPFRHQMDKVKKIPAEPVSIHKLPSGFENSLKAYVAKEYSKSTKFSGGETAGLERLHYYFSKPDLALNYFETRNGMIEFDDSTKFSPWLAWGCISANQIFFELKRFENKHRSNKSTYWIFFELLWRDYFKFLSLKFGDKIFDVKGTAGRELVFSTNQETLFKKWTNADTEEEFVNANMNELNLTGFMSNRGRQNVASYLTKTYEVNWLWGAEYFENNLIDADLESNQGNWAYQAGVGVDPRDRKFNIPKQQSMYDPDLEYTKKYSPKSVCP